MRTTHRLARSAAAQPEVAGCAGEHHARATGAGADRARSAERAPPTPKGLEDRSALPSVATGHPLKLRKFRNAALSELADE
jgi:hypothetical protein